MKRKLFVSAICFYILLACGTILNAANAGAKETDMKNSRRGLTNDKDWLSEKPEPVFDMTNVTLKKTNAEVYLVPVYSYGAISYDENMTFDVAINSPVMLDDTMHGIDLSCKSSNKKVQASASLSENILHFKIRANQKCKTKLTIYIAKKKFQIKVSIKPVNISANSLLLEKGKTKKLKLTGNPKGITWSSSNKKIATVSKKGVVKGKRTGNVMISAKIGKRRVGCSVSVTTSALKKVCERASYIGANWQYSQAKRALPGYYDCSSLVWKAYTECAGVNFGSSNYPGTSSTEAVWCNANNRLIPGGYSYARVLNMQLNPGDLIFKSRSLSNPFYTTYHVEMFTGYVCLGYGSNGKPIITSLWASRAPGYSAVSGSLLARPVK